MKRILNKILCWMWGHEYEDVWIKLILPGSRINGLPFLTERCKHCGAHKHD